MPADDQRRAIVEARPDDLVGLVQRRCSRASSCRGFFAGRGRPRRSSRTSVPTSAHRMSRRCRSLSSGNACRRLSSTTSRRMRNHVAKQHGQPPRRTRTGPSAALRPRRRPVAPPRRRGSRALGRAWDARSGIHPGAGVWASDVLCQRTPGAGIAVRASNCAPCLPRPD